MDDAQRDVRCFARKAELLSLDPALLSTRKQTPYENNNDIPTFRSQNPGRDIGIPFGGAHGLRSNS
jgi:hypothetical protein